MADNDNDTVLVRHPQYGERQIHKVAEPYFTNQGYEVVPAAKAATSASKDK